MRATVVIAGHNEGEHLWKTVASCVEACGCSGYETIVADDASTDGSVDELHRRFPQVRVVRHEERQGASPTKALGARHAHGDVLVFLDGHTKPEPGAVSRLIEDVENLSGEAVVMPQIPTLDPARWECDFNQAGAGYFVELDSFACGWLDISKLRAVSEAGKKFYESPAVIGCALAVSRSLYEKLRGFDPHMRLWGLEDLDFGLKCWLMGHRVLHDPLAVVGHRFRKSFDNFSVPMEQVVANQLRMARKNFTHSVWCEWAERCRQRHQGALTDYPQGVWTRSWQLFEADRASVEQERAYLHGQRVRDEFWFAERFGQSWPRLGSAGKAIQVVRVSDVDPSPSYSPPQCQLSGIDPSWTSVCVNVPQTFTAQGTNLSSLRWSAPGGVPSYGYDQSFTTQWPSPGSKTVSVSCGRSTQQAYVSVGQLMGINPSSPTVCVYTPITFNADGPYLDNLNWSASGGTPDTGSGASFTTQWYSPGDQTVSAWCGNDSKTITVKVGRTDSIDPADVVVGLNDTQQFNAVGVNTNRTQWSTDPAGDPSTATTDKFTTKWDEIGVKSIKAVCGPTYQYAQAEVVTVQLTVNPNNAAGDDDFVCQSDTGATDRPSVDLQVELIGPQGASAAVYLQSAGSGKVSFSDEEPEVQVGTPVIVKIYGDTASDTKNGTKVEARVKPGGVVQTTATLSVIDQVTIYYSGSFECRLATDPDPSNEKRGIRGWTVALEGEPDFDRIIRFSNPAVVRDACAFTQVTISKISSAKPAGAEFTKGDSVIGKTVNLGPSSFFDGARGAPGMEPIGDFKFLIGTNGFSGEATTDPKCQGGVFKLGSPATIAMFKAKLDGFKTAFAALTPDQQVNTVAGRNLNTRIRYLTTNMSPGGEWYPAIYDLNIDCLGDVDKNLQVTPGDSGVLKQYKNTKTFALKLTFSKFDGDCLLGQVSGTLKPKP